MTYVTHEETLGCYRLQVVADESNDGHADPRDGCNVGVMSVCPLDGGTVASERRLPGFLVCSTCAEILSLTELVRRASRRTRHRYLATQGTDTR